jgi:Acetyltransferase (GNAT) domain/Transposase IS200 like
MPGHVHLVISEPERSKLSVTIQMLKQITSQKRRAKHLPHFWQVRYYDFPVWTEANRIEKLRYIHRNPVKRGLVERPRTGNGAALFTMFRVRLSANVYREGQKAGYNTRPGAAMRSRGARKLESGAVVNSGIAYSPVPFLPPQWVPAVENLSFCIGGGEIAKLRLSALILNVPLFDLTTNLEVVAPAWETFPAGIEAAVVPAQPIESAPPRLSILPSTVRYITSPTNRYYIDLRGTFADYLKKFNAKQRYNLTREVRKFSELCRGQIDCRVFQTAEEIREFYRHGNEIFANSWKQGLGGPGLRGTVPEAEALHLAEQGLAQGYVLFRDGKPVAYVFCRGNREQLIYTHIGYDQQYAKWSPGTVLLYLILERLFTEQRYERLDLGEGTLGYKAFFSTHCIRCVRVIYFRRTVRNLALAWIHCALTLVSIALGRVVRKVGIKQRIKRLLMGKMYRASSKMNQP